MRRALFAITALLLIVGRAQDAAGQCSITSLDMNGVTTLCSDYGDDWRWTGPGGFASSNMCIDVPMDGTYTLRVFDAATSTWSEPCSHTVGNPPTAPGCAISGPDSVCAGASVMWCAPDGNFTLNWSGPNGFSETTACVAVSVAGTYTLTVTDPASGMSSEPCSQTLRVLDCSPPPPPPPGPMTKCPAPARWWASMIGEPDHGLDATQQAAIAQAVDDRSTALDFGGTPDGFHDLLSSRRHGRSFHSARRHFGAVLANIVANEMDVASDGRAIGLDPNMTLDRIEDVAPGTTLAAWVAATDAALAGMDEHSGRHRSGRETCRRIKSQAREINDARGTGCAGLAQNVLSDDDDDDDESFGGDDASMTFGGGGSGSSGGSTPFSGKGRVRFTLARDADVQLDILDLTGRRVKAFARGTLSAGTHEWDWDGRSDQGDALRPGAYFLVGRIGDVRMTQRLILLR